MTKLNDNQMCEIGEPVKAVLFDLDGTLLDTGEIIGSAFRYATNRVLRVAIPDKQLLSKVGQPLRTQMEMISPRYKDRLVETYNAHVRAHHDDLVKLFPGTKEALESLKAAGFPLGVVTSKRRALAEHGLKLFDILGYFDVIITPDDVDKHKPDPYPLVVGAEALGIPLKNCLYVGDSPFDMMAAIDGGAISVAALWGMFEADELRTLQPCFEAATIDDVVKIAERLSS